MQEYETIITVVLRGNSIVGEDAVRDQLQKKYKVKDVFLIDTKAIYSFSRRNEKEINNRN